MLICGKTGSGKTVATKYLSQYFVEELNGAVLAINVKDVDLLKMDQPSKTNSDNIKKEWNCLGKGAHGINNYRIYYPANSKISATKKINNEICEKITLDVKEIDPESLTGLLTKISDIAAMNLPNIFRWWQENQKEEDSEDFKFSNFVEYFKRGAEDRYFYNTLNTKGEESTITLHRGTYDNILRSLDVATDFFDNEGAKVLHEDDILFPGKMSVIDITDKKNGVQFGSILLRDLLHRIVEAKSELRSEVPILIVIDEVHMFYNTDASYEALGELDTICRTGRSQKIGVIFSSQNPQDIPKGLSSVINTKIFFKSDIVESRKFGITISDQEIENLRKGFAVVSIHDLSQLKIVKFPLAFCGVFE
jgi:DNA helicase HerA-like ATPase